MVEISSVYVRVAVDFLGHCVQFNCYRGVTRCEVEGEGLVQTPADFWWKRWEIIPVSFEFLFWSKLYEKKDTTGRIARLRTSCIVVQSTE